MALKKLKKADWQSYLELISHGIARGLRAELEVQPFRVGDHVEAAWVLVEWLVYRPDTDLLAISIKSAERLVTVAQPRDVFLAAKRHGIVGLEIVGPDMTRRVVRFLQAFSLPPHLRRELRGRGKES